MSLPTLAHAFRRLRALPRTTAWLACCTVAVIIFGAICLAAVLAARADADRRADAVASDTAAWLSRDIARTIEQFDRALQTTIARLRSPHVMAQSEPARSLLLFDHAAGLRHLGFINVLDENGRVTAPPQPPERAANWANRDYFTAQRLDAAAGLYISRPFGTAQDEFASVALSRRVSHDDGSFAGVVIASLRLGYFRDLFRQTDMGPHASIALLRSDDTLLMRLPFNAGDIGRVAAPEAGSDQMRRRFAVRQIGELPLFLRVGVADQDVAGAWQGWALATLAAGALLVAVSLALMIALRREARLREAADRSDRRKSDYLAMASHELRTPLHSILANADRLRTEVALDPTEGRCAAAIVSAGEQLRGVVDQILNCLQIEAAAPTPRMGRVRLRDLLEQCCLVARWDAAAKGLSLRHDATPDAPEHFVTDYNLLRQVLANLLANAIKYTARGEVVVTARGTSERVTIEVLDTGCGIPPRQRHKLFKYGERLGAERTDIPGHGIGLATSRRLVQCMGGDIGYRENTGGGSVFWVSLPGGVPVAEPSAKPEAAPPAALRVLLVDDVAMNREVARCYLEQRGHAVTEAPSGVDAVRLAGDNDFDVVLMDMRMPGMDGLEATRRIRLLDGPRGLVPIIAVTANALDHQVVEGRRAGMVAHVVKPFTAEELLTVVERVARHADLPVFDPSALRQLARFMSSGEMERHLLELARRLEHFLTRLDGADLLADTDALGDLAHEVAGTAGTFGFAALSTVARRFEVGVTDAAGSAAPLAGALASAIRAALAELRELTAPESVEAE